MKMASYLNVGAVLAFAAVGHATAQSDGPVVLSVVQMDAVVAGYSPEKQSTIYLYPNPQSDATVSVEDVDGHYAYRPLPFNQPNTHSAYFTNGE